MKMWKVYDNANNNDWQSRNMIRKAHLSLWLRWAKKFSIMYFYYFAIISTFSLHLKKKTWIIFTQGCFVQSLVENGPVVLEKSSQCIFTISQLSPFWEGCGPPFEQTWIPFTQECFVSSLVEIGLAVLEMKIFKSCQFIFIIFQSPLWEIHGPSFE